MLKTIIVLIGIFIIGNSAFSQGNTEILRKWDASNKFRGGIVIYCAKGNKVTKEYTTDSSKSGSLKVKILESKQKGASNIQLTFVFRGKIEQGKKYSIKISLQSNKSGQIIACAIMNNRPWSALAKNSLVKASLQTDKSKDIVIEFEAGKSFNNIRVPCLFLGKLEQGTELSIKSVVFKKVISSNN